MRISLNIVDNILLCPKCNENNLHQGSIHVFKRNVGVTEDGPLVYTYIEPTHFTTKILEKTIGIEQYIKSNPTENRRESIHISLWCEHCSSTVGYLKIEQHQGNTYLNYENEIS